MGIFIGLLVAFATAAEIGPLEDAIEMSLNDNVVDEVMDPGESLDTLERGDSFPDARPVAAEEVKDPSDRDWWLNKSCKRGQCCDKKNMFTCGMWPNCRQRYYQYWCRKTCRRC